MRAKTTIGTAFLAVGIAMAVATANAAPPSFQVLVKTYYDNEFRAHPISATRTGIHDYDTKVDDLSAQGYAANIARLHAALDTFTAATPSTDGERDDRDVLVSAIKGELLDLETIQYWRKNPDIYSGAATGAVFNIVHRDFAPAAERLRLVVARELLIPALLADGKANIAHPPRAFVEIDGHATEVIVERVVPVERAGVLRDRVEAAVQRRPRLARRRVRVRGSNHVGARRVHL